MIFLWELIKNSYSAIKLMFVSQNSIERQQFAGESQDSLGWEKRLWFVSKPKKGPEEKLEWKDKSKKWIPATCLTPDADGLYGKVLFFFK